MLVLTRTSTKNKAAIFDIDGIISDDSIRKAMEIVTGNDQEYFNPNILDHIPYNQFIVDLIKKKKSDGYRIIIITKRDKKLDIVTHFWLSRVFDFCYKILFKPDDFNSYSFNLYYIGILQSLIDIYDLDELEVYLKTHNPVLKDYIKSVLINSVFYIVKGNELELI